MSRIIFSRLTAKAMEESVIIKDDSAARWIMRHSEEDATLAAKSTIVPLILSRQLRVASISHDEQNFVAMCGFSECPELPAGLERASLTPGIFGLAISELALRPSATGYLIRDVIEDRFLGVTGYNGHSMEEIEPLFPTVYCYRVNSRFEIARSLDRLVGSYLARSYVDGPLELDYGLRVALTALFESGSRYIPFNLVLQGLLSFSWPGFFIELYRCIEQLYALPRLSELVAEWPNISSLHDTAEMIERVLGWRPREDESLVRLLQMGCAAASLNVVCRSMKVEPITDLSRSAELAARSIYRMRNSHVHFRPTNSENDLSSQEWNNIIHSMLSLVTELYGKFGRVFWALPITDLQ